MLFTKSSVSKEEADRMKRYLLREAELQQTIQHKNITRLLAVPGAGAWAARCGVAKPGGGCACVRVRAPFVLRYDTCVPL